MAEHPHGDRRRYKAGCRCDLCRLAEAEYKKRNRQRRKLEAVPSLGADVSPIAPAGESVSQAVAREIEGLAGVDTKPGLVAAAMAMARLLDNPVAIAQHPTAVARLMDVMTDLRKGGKKDRGKLAAARDMIG